jgi:hypothetical protein
MVWIGHHCPEFGEGHERLVGGVVPFDDVIDAVSLGHRQFSCMGTTGLHTDKCIFSLLYHKKNRIFNEKAATFKLGKIRYFFKVA